jgi:DNA polymerase III epsilon subunit-like protein
MIIVDLETTDLLDFSTQDPTKQPGIVQVGLIEITRSWELHKEHKWLVNPEIPASLWHESAIKTHGIKPEDVVNAPTLPGILPTLAAIFRAHDTWVGYNNPFDRQVLYHQVCRYGWQWRFPWPSRDTDIMAIGKDVCNIAGKQGVKAPKLVELHSHLFGVSFDGAHDAMEDCRATLRCGQKLHEMELV